MDDHFKTNSANIFAIGDAIAGPMLAHKVLHSLTPLSTAVAASCASTATAVVVTLVVVDSYACLRCSSSSLMHPSSLFYPAHHIFSVSEALSVPMLLTAACLIS